MREACIILPVLDGFNSPLHKENATAHARLAERIVATFGGLTKTTGEGFWQESDGVVIRDSVAIYTFAIAEDEINDDVLVDDIAIEAARLLQQKAVYVRYPNGDARIIDLTAWEAWERVEA